MKKLLPLAVLALTANACLYTNVTVPRAYRSAAPSEVKASPTDPVVTGTACFRSVLYMVAWGDGGVAAACRNALAGQSDKVLYDVKSDIKQFSVVLGLYSRTCTRIEGRVAQP
jgi:hypothetical protein